MCIYTGVWNLFQMVKVFKNILGQEYINNWILVEMGITKNASHLEITLTKHKKAGKQLICFAKSYHLSRDTGQISVTKFCKPLIFYQMGSIKTQTF